MWRKLMWKVGYVAENQVLGQTRRPGSRQTMNGETGR